MDIDFEVVVVNNNSTDKTAGAVMNYPVKLITEKKQGPAAARNAGLKEAHGEYIAFVDVGVILPANWLKKMICLLSSSPDIGAVEGISKSINCNYVGRLINLTFCGLDVTKIRTRDIYCLTTRNVLLRRSTINGMEFDEQLITGEDTDFFFKLRNKGFRLLVTEDPYVYHCNPCTLKDVLKKWFYYGEWYLIPYLRYKNMRTIYFWGRLFYVPVLLFTLFLSLYIPALLMTATFIFMCIPIAYFLSALRIGLWSKPLDLFLFCFIYSLKEWARLIGIWFGFLRRLLKNARI
jgi:cellulose synthase/poly-beta-1,6-N-acetylglucosamine synthase-like glycosyltransferase